MLIKILQQADLSNAIDRSGLLQSAPILFSIIVDIVGYTAYTVYIRYTTTNKGVDDMIEPIKQRAYEYDYPEIKRLVDSKDEVMFLTPNEVATYFGITSQTVRKWITKGKLECYKYKVGFRPFIGITGKQVSTAEQGGGATAFKGVRYTE